MKKICFILAFILYVGALFGQCDIRSVISPDGAMYYHGEVVLFYKTSQLQLQGGVVTDKENYFLTLSPHPYPPKPQGNKLKDNLVVKLSNDSTYTLKYFDSRYDGKDTAFFMTYLLPKKNINAFVNNDIVEVIINLGGEGPVSCRFKLHADAVKKELECFISKKNNF